MDRIGAPRAANECPQKGSIDGDEKVELALLGPDLGNVDVEEAAPVDFEFLRWFVSLDVRQSADAVALQALVQLLALR